MTSAELLRLLKAENIKTWFDLGLFIDRVKDKSHQVFDSPEIAFKDFKKSLTNGGVAFFSFFYSVDGASMECHKYVKALRHILGDFKVHYFAGKFYETGHQYLLKNSEKLQFDELLAFDDWEL